MFTYAELMEIEDLCQEDARFEKYMERIREENSQLLAKVSHEIGNPLTIIYSTIQLMESRDPNIKEQKYWNQLSMDVKNLSLLLQDYSNYDSCSTLNIENENLYEILQNVSNSFEAVFQEAQIDWSFKVSDEILPIMESFPCDKIKIRQVFINIIKNAVEAVNTNGRIWIDIPKKGIKVEDMVQGEDCIVIMIGNNGSPIAKDELKGMFTPLLSSKSGGCGIGLSISNKITVSHGGIIFVTSNDEETVFTIALPL